MTLFTLSTTQFADRMNEGGPFMYFILITFLLSLVFLVLAFIKRKSDQGKASKFLGLSVDSSLLALVLGCLGSVVGIIQLFDMVESLGNVNPAIFSGGLKVSLLTITFGLFAFAISRIGILAYRWTASS